MGGSCGTLGGEQRSMESFGEEILREYMTRKT
jgi:hypothetical protein